MSVTHTPITVEWDAKTDALCSVIVHAVAEAKNVDPLDLDTPLYDIVDPDALEDLFGKTTHSPLHQSSRIRFSFEGCEVIVAANGAITVCPEVPTADDRHRTTSVIGERLDSI